VVQCRKSWENAGFVSIEEVQEVEELLHTLEKREVMAVVEVVRDWWITQDMIASKILYLLKSNLLPQLGRRLQISAGRLGQDLKVFGRPGSLIPSPPWHRPVQIMAISDRTGVLGTQIFGSHPDGDGSCGGSRMC